MRGAISRQRLLAGVKEAIDVHGIESVTVSEIAAAAEVSVGTFYKHFPDKHTAFEAIGLGHIDLIDMVAAVRSLHHPETRWMSSDDDQVSFASYQDLVDAYPDDEAPTEAECTTFQICDECARIERSAHEDDGWSDWGYKEAIWPCRTAKQTGATDAQA